MAHAFAAVEKALPTVAEPETTIKPLLGHAPPRQSTNPPPMGSRWANSTIGTHSTTVITTMALIVQRALRSLIRPVGNDRKR